MYKKTLINLTAITMAMSIAFAPTVTAFAAETGSYPEIVSETWNHNEGEVLEHTGDVTNDSSDYSAVYADGSAEAPAVVKQNGDATNVNDHWRAVGAYEYGTVEVTGDASGNYGAGAFKDSTVIIDGNVTGRTDNGIRVQSDSYMIVDGDVNSQMAGIVTDGSSTVIVGGDVNSSTTGISVQITDINGERKCICTTCGANPCTCDHDTGDNKNIIVVEGTIKADGTGIYVQKDNDELTNCNIPTIIVYEIDAQNAISSNDAEVEDYLKNHVQYIVKNDSGDKVKVEGLYSTTVKKIDSIDVDTTNKTVSENTSNLNLLTTTLNHAFTVAVEQGYELTAGDNVSMVLNEDGTYTITLTNSKGGITLSARLIQVAAPTTEAVTASGSSETHEQVVEEAPAIFATFTVTGRTDLPEVLGASRDGGIVESNRPVVTVKANGNLTALQYKRTFIDTVKNAPQGAIVRLETSASYCIDKMMMEALAARADLTLEVTFPVNHEKTTVVVPAGYDHMSLLDENGYCGFLYLASVFNK
jgi:hypothetical protein